MNTDKNGWPYLIVLPLMAFSLFGLNYNTDKMFILLIGGFVFMWFWSCLGLFLTLVFSEQMKMTPLYKKLVFSFLPLIYLSTPCRSWLLKEFEEGKKNGAASNT